MLVLMTALQSPGADAALPPCRAARCAQGAQKAGKAFRLPCGYDGMAGSQTSPILAPAGAPACTGAAPRGLAVIGCLVDF